MCGNITLSTRTINSMILVVACFIVAIVRINSSTTTCSKIFNTCSITCYFILTISILIIAICKIVFYILQFIITNNIITSFQIILIEVVSNLSIQEVFVSISFVRISIETINNRLGSLWLVFETAMVFTRIVFRQ